jgi:hypothetical protein
VSRPRFLADHNLDQQIVDGLLRDEPAVDVVVARDVGLDQTPDPVLLARASDEGWVVVTHDVNTMVGFAIDRIRKVQPMVGLVIVPKSLRVGVAIDGLLLVWTAMEAEELHDQIIFLPV